jgi:hypothetical protein
VYALDFGISLGCGSPQEMRHNPQVVAAYLGDEQQPASVPQESVPTAAGGDPGNEARPASQGGTTADEQTAPVGQPGVGRR